MGCERFLDAPFICACGQRHHAPTQAIVVADDALDRLADVISRLGARRVAVVADVRTQAVAGAAAGAQVARVGCAVQAVVLPDRNGRTPVCDEPTKCALAAVVGEADVLVAAGSGVVNDLTKWLAFERERPYIVVATAASMNGYTAANVAPTINGVKMLVRARAPLALFAVPDVILNAPYAMTTAGLGDVIAKPVSAADWRLNSLVVGEHFCPLCAGIINDIEPLYLDHPEHIRACDRTAVMALLDALLYSGLAMTLIGSSAPASGGEHLFSHTLDMMSALDGVPHDLHGRQVGVGTIIAARIYEHIMAIDTPRVHMPPADIDVQFWGPLAPAVRAAYQAKQAHLVRFAEMLRQPDQWQQVKAAIAPHLRSSRAIADCLAQAGAACTAVDIGCDLARVRQAVLHMHEIRARTTIVDLAWLLGVLPDAADVLI
ncbi:MAG: iron-containing alcohol dehydrogenase [bacterium]|nr:iron-containing alcohol dehydrogenase [bacterium]